MSSDSQAGHAMDIHQILDYLPHRYPFLMVDRVVSCVPGDSIVCVKNVTINEPFFVGHFPQRAVMPGVLVIEALAQACGLLAFRTREAEHAERLTGSNLFYLVGVEGARFKRPVEPGDQLELRVRFDREKRGIWFFEAEAQVNGKTAVVAEIRCTMKEV